MENDSTNGTVEMEVFRAGDYGRKGVYGEADLDALAGDYDPARHEAPLTFDHAQSGPAFGWVERLRRSGDRLVAIIGGVPESVRGLIRAGAYKKRSIEVMRRLRETGRPYVRAVSLLGAAMPEVQGLRPVKFAAGEDAAAAPDGADDGAATLADVVRFEAHDGDGGAEVWRERARKAEAGAMVARLRAEGLCLSPDDAAMLGELAALLPDEGEVRFSAGCAAGAWLEDFLRRSLGRVPLGEESAAFASGSAMASPGEPADPRVGAASLRLHRMAEAHRAAHPGMPYAEALSAVSRAAGPR